MTNLKQKSYIVFILIIVLVISSCFNIPSADAATTQSSSKDELGFLFISSDLENGDGFINNYKYLTSDEFENLKVNRNPQNYGLGDSWVVPKMYSSFEDHGEPVYRYHLVEGLNFHTIIDEVVSGGASEITKYFIYSSNNYTSSIGSSNTNNLKYYAPGDMTGTSGAFAMLALYKTDSPNYSLKSSIPGAQNFPSVANPISKGHYVLMMGQTDVDDQNHCQFVHEANTIKLISKTSSDNYTIRSGHNARILALNDLMNMGIYRNTYNYSDTSKTYKVEGVPLTTVMESLGINKYMASHSNNIVSIQSIDGKTMTLPYDKYLSSYIAWNFTDSTTVPAEQNSQYALYSNGNNESDSVLYNIKEINVTDEKGNLATTVPVSPSTPTPTVKTEVEEVKNATKKPGKSKISKISKKGKKSVVVKYKYISGANGYQIVYGTNKKITKSKKTVAVKKGSTKSKTISKLKKGKRYYFKVRAYKTVNGRKVYGAYSSVKSFKL